MRLTRGLEVRLESGWYNTGLPERIVEEANGSGTSPHAIVHIDNVNKDERFKLAMKLHPGFDFLTATCAKAFFTTVIDGINYHATIYEPKSEETQGCASRSRATHMWKGNKGRRSGAQCRYMMFGSKFNI